MRVAIETHAESFRGPDTIVVPSCSFSYRMELFRAFARRVKAKGLWLFNAMERMHKGHVFRFERCAAEDFPGFPTPIAEAMKHYERSAARCDCIVLYSELRGAADDPSVAPTSAALEQLMMEQRFIYVPGTALARRHWMDRYLSRDYVTIVN